MIVLWLPVGLVLGVLALALALSCAEMAGRAPAPRRTNRAAFTLGQWLARAGLAYLAGRIALHLAGF